MRSLALIALIFGACNGCAHPAPAPVTQPPTDAATPAPTATVHSACLRLCAMPCSKWCPSTQELCESGLATLTQSGMTVKLDCLAGVASCDTTDCVQ